MAQSGHRAVPVTQHQLKAIMPKASSKYLHSLNHAMTPYGITTPKRVAAFLGQIAVESSELQHRHERWTAKKDFELDGVARPKFTAHSQAEYFEHWYGGNKTLGNVEKGDGYKFRGRGILQVTGRSNYTAVYSFGAGGGRSLAGQADSNP